MITEQIMYDTKKYIKSISSDNESLSFLFDDKFITFPAEYMGLNITSLFLSEVEMRHFNKMVYNKNGVDEIFSASYTDDKLTGLLSSTRLIRFVYENNLIVSFNETKGSDIREWVYVRDDEGKLIDIRITLNNVSDDFKDIIYSENDTVIGYNDRLKYNLFKFDIFGITNFESEGNSYTVVYE
jgi:hypothetical protein